MASTTLDGVLLKGVAGSRPAANAVAKGTIYSATDTGAITQSDGVSTWSTYATIAAGIADQGVITYLDGTVAAAPGTPAAGKLRIYAKTGKVLAVKDDAGVETVFGAGGGAGALVLLEQHTASASASLDFTTCISSTYDEYVIECVGIVPATNSVAFWMRMGTGGGPTYDTGANYGWHAFTMRAGGTGSAGAESGATKIQLGFSTDTVNTSTKGIDASFRLFNAQSTALHKRIMGQLVNVDSGTFNLLNAIQGIYLSVTALTAFQFLMSSGNIASGVIRVYGIAK